MTQKEKLDLAVQALMDVADPVGMLRRQCPEGCTLNGSMVVQIQNDPYFFRKIAEDALKRLAE